MRVACVLLLGLAPGCMVLENPSVLTDSTGAELTWECELGRCTARRERHSPAAPDCDGPTELLVGAGAYAVVCAVTGETVHEATCRPVVCNDELDCPQWEQREYACVEGRCRTPLALDRVDLAALCLWDVQRHASCADALADPEVARRLAAVDRACEGRSCRAPTAECGAR